MTTSSQQIHLKRNFTLLVLEWVLFGSGQAFFSAVTVVPSFLSTLGAPPFMVGLLSTVQSASWLLPQLYAARYLADKPYRKPYFFYPPLIGRITIVLLALLVAATSGQPTWLIIGACMLIVMVSWIGTGLAHPAWLDFLTKMIPATRLGRFYAAGQAISSLTSFAVGFIVEALLRNQNITYPNNYALLFLIGGLMSVSATFLMLFLREDKGTSMRRIQGWAEFLPGLVRVLRHDAQFRRYISLRLCFNMLLSLAAPFYMIYALDRLGLPVYVAGRFTSISVVGSMLASLVYAWINERHNSLWVIRLSVVTGVLIPATALVTPIVITNLELLGWVFGMVFFLNNFIASSGLPGWTSYMLHFAPEADRPTYTGLTNTLVGITNMTFAAIGGLFLQASGNHYELLFALACAGLLLLVPMTIFMRKPNKEK